MVDDALNVASGSHQCRGWSPRFLRGVLALGALAAAYLVVMFPFGCGKSLANRMLLFPSTDPVRADGTSDRFINTPAGRVHVVAVRGGAALLDDVARYVVRFEGNASRAEYTALYVAERWADDPTEVWAVNHPGFGQSDGPATLESLGPAALAVYDAALAEAAGRPVFVDADSMGTAMALHVAAERTGPQAPAALVLKNPPPLRELVMGRFGWWNLWLGAIPVAAAIPRELDSIANARRATSPAVFVGAEADTLVPIAYQRRIADAYAGPKETITLPGAEHNSLIEEESELAIRAAIRSLLKPLTPDVEDVP